MSTDFEQKSTVFKLFEQEVKVKVKKSKKKYDTKYHYYHVIFHSKENYYVIPNVIYIIEAFPQPNMFFGSPTKLTKYYRLNGWGEEEYISERMINCLIEQLEENEVDYKQVKKEKGITLNNVI